MNHKKIILVGFISAFVAITTAVLGVAGTIIGSVMSSVLYNMLTESLTDPVNKASFNTTFEWDIAYIFPLAVISLIQLLLIFALLSEAGFLPGTFLNAYLILQHFADNNLYKILGVSLIVMSVYPFLLKSDNVKKSYGVILAFVGLVFLARGFADFGNAITRIYDGFFIHFDLHIAVILLCLLLFVIFRILLSSKKSDSKSHKSENENQTNPLYQRHERIQNSINNQHSKSTVVKRVDNSFNSHHNSERINNIINSNDFKSTRDKIKRVNRENAHKKYSKSDVHFDKKVTEPKKAINKSSNNIHFESNDLLDDYKK